MTAANVIRVHDLVVDHPTPTGPFRALDFPEFAVAGGSSVAITGPSGCGKSTLLGVLAGLAMPTAGSVTIGTTDISSLSEPDRVRFRKDAIGVVYQADTGDAMRRTADLLDRLGLGELGARLPDQLSGGQRQRAAIVRAIVHRPSVILADEPTGSLDEANASVVIQLLLDAHQDIGSTLVIVTHQLSIAERMERLVALRDGSIVDDRDLSYVH